MFLSLRKFLTFGIIAFAIFVFLHGETPKRRYESLPCVYNAVFENRIPAGLVTAGGSRLMVSTPPGEISEELGKRGVPHLRGFNIAHSIYGVETEYVIIRDFLEQHQAKSLVIMLNPRHIRGLDYVQRHLSSVAKTSDVFEYMRTSFWDNPTLVLSTSLKIISNNFKFFEKIPSSKIESEPVSDCSLEDGRLNLKQLEIAYNRYEVYQNNEFEPPLDWDFSKIGEASQIEWVRKINTLASKQGTQVFFLVISSGKERLPSPETAALFKKATGSTLLYFDKELYSVLSENGMRDFQHLNIVGRNIFIPWLIDEVTENCTRKDGCF
jgi:hypothetical protein